MAVVFDAYETHIYKIVAQEFTIFYCSTYDCIENVTWSLSMYASKDGEYL